MSQQNFKHDSSIGNVKSSAEILRLAKEQNVAPLDFKDVSENLSDDEATTNEVDDFLRLLREWRSEGVIEDEVR